MNSDPPPGDLAVATATAGGYNPCSCCSSLPSCGCDFLFAYNNSNLSDRVLRIEIVDSSSSSSSSSVESSNCDSTADRPEKKMRLDNQNDTGEHSPEGTHNNDPKPTEVPSRVVRVETIHINSAILAARSLFFQKLFLNGMMRESQQKHATLQINSSEEAAVTELLKFMYGKSIYSTSTRDVLDILMVADKYEVSSCKWCCCQLLQNMPMSLESALLYLELPSSLSMTKKIMDLTKLAKRFLVDRYKDMTKLDTEMMELPLVGIEAVLSSDDLQAVSEDQIYDFVVKWAQTHYQNIEERREILATCLTGLVRLPYMSRDKLKMILNCEDVECGLLLKLVLNALFFITETTHRKNIIAMEQANDNNRGFVERNYSLRPIKAVDFSSPRQHSVVYFNLKRRECLNLFPSSWLRSREFDLAGQAFYLSAGCSNDQQKSIVSFGVCLGMEKVGLTSVQVEFGFAARSKLTDDYMSKFRSATTILTGGGAALGHLNLFNMPWSAFIQDECEYFINGMLHLRAEVTITG